MTNRALIFGVTGQDGSYLAELLLSLGYEVHGAGRPRTQDHFGLVEPFRQHPQFTVHACDVTDFASVVRLVRRVEPSEVYNLAAQSHVHRSFEQPAYTLQVVAQGTLNILEALRGGDCRFYQASSSEMFGSAPPPQSETTPFQPRSPYAAAKLLAHHLTVNYREAHGLFACSGILFNHESPRRGPSFVTRKITQGAVRIKLGLQQDLALGNLDARRDWGFAGDYVAAMWWMLQHPTPQDFVIATGQSHTVRDVLEIAFGKLGLTWAEHVVHDPRLCRPAEVEHLCGDSRRAAIGLGWQPTVGFQELIERMVEHDLAEQSQLGGQSAGLG